MRTTGLRPMMAHLRSVILMAALPERLSGPAAAPLLNAERLCSGYSQKGSDKSLSA
jgi:hypothetical protein